MTLGSNSGEAPAGHPPDPLVATAPHEEAIRRAFLTTHDEGRAALMPYMMAGFPNHESSLAVAASYVDNGADLIGLGVPFSHPVADGPAIHAAAIAALAAGASMESALEVCESVAGRVPVVLMVY